jgi:hypothetical protein
MTEITKDHVEWAVVDRMRRMLEEPPSGDFGVTETYALFTTTLCWVLQHLRIKEDEAHGPADEATRHLWANLQEERAFDPPWIANTAAFRRLVVVDGQSRSCKSGNEGSAYGFSRKGPKPLTASAELLSGLPNFPDASSCPAAAPSAEATRPTGMPGRR